MEKLFSFFSKVKRSPPGKNSKAKFKHFSSWEKLKNLIIEGCSNSGIIFSSFNIC